MSKALFPGETLKNKEHEKKRLTARRSESTKDLLVDPTTRGVTAVRHTVVAAASSSSKTRAETFLRGCQCPNTARAYGSYSDLVNDSDVEIVYIASPHSHHYQNAMLCLEAGKHVLCEKAFTVNAAQAKALVKKAREMDLFLMEALWVRYFPVSLYVRDVIESGRLGLVERVLADNSLAKTDILEDHKHIMLDPALAGGTLLDSGIYSLNWVLWAMYLGDPARLKLRPSVKSLMTKFEPTGVDAMTTILLDFPRDQSVGGGNAHGVASSSLWLSNDSKWDQDQATPAVRIQGRQGEISLFPPAFRPTRSRLTLKDGTIEDKLWPQPGPGAGSGFYNGFSTNSHAEGEGHGMFWEADGAGLALIEGRKEGRNSRLDESVLMMEIMDEVRRQGCLQFPGAIESTEYPLQLPGR